MKKGMITVFISLLLLSLLTACQTSASLDSNLGDNNKEEDKTMNESKNDKKSSNINEQISSFNVAGESESSFSIGDIQQVDGLTITLVNARKIEVDHIDPNKDHFLGIELLIENNSDSEIQITTLPQILLVANDEKQDMAILTDTKGDLILKVKPGTSISGEIAFDSTKSDYYSLVFKDLETEKIVFWNFTNEDIYKDEK